MKPNHSGNVKGPPPRSFLTRLRSSVRLYRIASNASRDVDDWYPTQAEADAALRTILEEAPELEGKLWVEAVDVDEPSTN